MTCDHFLQPNSMTTQLIRSLALAATLALGLTAPAHATNLVTNGDFGTNDFTGWTQFGNTGFTGVGSFTFGVASFGPVGSTGGIYQDVTTSTGTSYNVSFDLANDGNTPNYFAVSWGGGILTSLSDAGGFGWTNYSFNVVGGLGTSTNLSFTFQHNPAWYHLDNVSVTATNNVPDPASTVMLLGLGLLGLVAMRRRLA
jgi:hypothetical protein